MTELKTLNDIAIKVKDVEDHISRQALRKEAIKWIKEINKVFSEPLPEKIGWCIQNLPEDMYTILTEGQIDGILSGVAKGFVRFFNITEEDLK